MFQSDFAYMVRSIRKIYIVGKQNYIVRQSGKTIKISLFRKYFALFASLGFDFGRICFRIGWK